MVQLRREGWGSTGLDEGGGSRTAEPVSQGKLVRKEAAIRQVEGMFLQIFIGYEILSLEPHSKETIYFFYKIAKLLILLYYYSNVCRLSIF